MREVTGTLKVRVRVQYNPYYNSSEEAIVSALEDGYIECVEIDEIYEDYKILPESD